MRVTGSRVYSRPAPVPKMPPGLVELMEGLTRDVLKNNPTDVYEFCADHMKKLLDIRDGPSTKKKISLEQKILRAQEKVKKRAEQRWLKFKEELQVNPMPDNDNSNNAPLIKSIAGFEDITHTVHKPVHHDHDLTQTSEIEISCESGNDLTHGEHDDVLKIDDQTAVIESKTILETENEPVLKENSPIEVTIDAPSEFLDQKNLCDNSIVINTNLSETLGNNDLSIENDDKDVPKIINNCHNEGGAITAPPNNNHKDETVEENAKNEVISDDSQLSDPSHHHDSITVANVDVVVKNPDIETTEHENNSNFPINSKTKTVTNPEPENTTEHEKNSNFPNNSNTITVTNPEPENIEEPSEKIEELVNDVKTKPDGLIKVDIEEKIEKKEITQNILLPESNEYSSGTEDDVKKAEVFGPIAITDSTDNLDNLDIETVVNEAIENIKRKDSSAYDSLKHINILQEEESDTSECSNLVDHNIKPTEENNDVSKNIDANEIEKNTIDQLKQSDMATENTEDVEEITKSKRDVTNDITIQDSNKNQVVHVDIVTTEKLDNSTGVEASNVEKTIDSANTNEINQNENSNAMDLETAAVTIQKVFRTFLFKSRASTFDETVNDENNLSEDEKKDDMQFLPNTVNKERRALGISRMDTVLQTVNEEKSLSLSTDDSSLSSAATIIQAHVRGFLVRNKLNSGKTASTNSLPISNELSNTSMDGDNDQNKSKTILNIHIVPEGGNYLSRDESMITSMDLSLDGSPPSSVNLHPLGYNTSERRKLLKREDAVQSVSPPSNNSGKLSEDVDSVKELAINENESNINQDDKVTMASLLKDDSHQETEIGSIETTPTNSLTVETVLEDNKTSNTDMLSSPEPVSPVTESSDQNKRSLTKQSSDEMDVVTPFKENSSPRNDTQKLLHSGEFHDAALPTKLSRSDTPVVSEFKNVLVYFLLWNNS